MILPEAPSLMAWIIFSMSMPLISGANLAPMRIPTLTNPKGMLTLTLFLPVCESVTRTRNHRGGVPLSSARPLALAASMASSSLAPSSALICPFSIILRTCMRSSFVVM